MISGFLRLAAFLLLPLVCSAQVRITFLPPPMSGRLSLGIYDKTGKLVRTLAREAEEKDFVVGLNGLITHWDGKNEAGQPVPAGTYSARGYSVGEIEVEGVAIHGNDWISDEDSPHLAQIHSIAAGPGDILLLLALKADGSALTLRCDRDGKTQPASPEQAKPFHPPASPETPPSEKPIEGITKALAGCPGRNGAIWVIDQTDSGIEVKEFSRERELTRLMRIPADQPQPCQIAAAMDSDLIFLLERGPGIERVRSLARDDSQEANLPGRSDWKTLLSKSILSFPSFNAFATHFKREKLSTPKARVRLLPNPLFQDAVQEVDILLAIDAKGAFFRTADGLPLTQITETPNLKWAAMGRDNKAIVVFQSDGAVVEEFKARRLANMMAFDAGDYSWKP